MAAGAVIMVGSMAVTMVGVDTLTMVMVMDMVMDTTIIIPVDGDGDMVVVVDTITTMPTKTNRLEEHTVKVAVHHLKA
jgi:hypothetical protein